MKEVVAVCVRLQEEEVAVVALAVSPTNDGTQSEVKEVYGCRAWTRSYQYIQCIFLKCSRVHRTHPGMERQLTSMAAMPVPPVRLLLFCFVRSAGCAASISCKVCVRTFARFAD